MKFDAPIWARWAEKANIMSSGINFILKNPEIIEGAGESLNADDKGKTLRNGNIRVWTKYFESLMGIPNLQENLELVMNLGMGSLPSEHIILFTVFIKEGLDRIHSPHVILQDTKKAMHHFGEVIKKGNEKRNDIGSIISTRLLNYTLINHDQPKYTEEMVDTYFDLLESGYLNKELVILTIKKLQSLPKFRKMVTRSKLLNMVAPSK
jgi:hypothetical protein